MTLRALMRVHEEVLRQGWALTSASEMGLDTASTRDALSPALAPDPRAAGKLQALDVVTYDRTGAHLMVAEAETLAPHGVPGTARCYLIATPPQGLFTGDLVARTVLQMVPVSLRRKAGQMTVTYLRYSPGTGVAAHQDRFGDMVAIWVLGREGDGGENFLIQPGGEEVFRRHLMPGEMVIFRDEMFHHGVTAMSGPGAFRDALVFITLRDGS